MCGEQRLDLWEGQKPLTFQDSFPLGHVFRNTIEEKGCAKGLIISHVKQNPEHRDETNELI